MNSKNKDFLKIDDIIKRAKERGVDFGNAKPRSRLRYYAKLGLIPPAERKVFNGNNQPTGAYPKYVLEILEEIDEKIEKGKSIREIAKEKKEKEKEQLKEDLEKEQNKKEKSKIPSPSSIVPKHVADLLEKIDEKLGKGKQVNFGKENIEESPKEEVSYEGPAITLTPTYRKKEKVNERKKESGLKKEDFKKEKEKSHSFFFSLARFGIFILLMGVLGLMLSLGFFGEDLSANLLNGLYADNEIKSNNLKADLLSQSGGGSTAQQNVLSNFKSEPYFNINVETDVNAPLNLKGKATTSPTLSFYQNDFQGTLTTSDLTSDQTYNLPDQSGTVCLSSGNCETGGEEQITVTDGIDGRLTKFTGPNSITSASISDLYEGESILNITEEGDIGIGTENPARKLEVAGSIFASPTEGEENAVFGSESSLSIESNNNLGVHVNEEGNVGIGTTEAENEFQVEGRIQASGDICTDAGGGKCLSDLDSGSSFIPSGGGGIDGSGSSGYIARWTGSDEVGDSTLYQTSNRIGIGNTNPTSTLHISGTTTMSGFQMPTNATSGYVLTADSSGVGKWMPSQSLPSATTSQTLYYDGSDWSSNSLLTNTGSAIGIGTTSPSSPLTVEGEMDVSGTTTFNDVSYSWPSSDGSSDHVLSSDGSGNLVWKDVEGTSDADWYVSDSAMYSTPDVDNVGIGTSSPSEILTLSGTSSITEKLALSDSNNFLDLNLSTTSAEIKTDGDLTINSLSGEIKVGDGNVVLASATGSPTVRGSGEYVLRGSVPIFKYSWAGGAQTNSTNYKKISKTFDSDTSLSSSTPEKLDGATRYYTFLINYADQIDSESNSEWRVYRPNADTTSLSFNLSGQDMTNLDEGKPITSDYYSASEIPDNDWQFEVRVPTEDNIRVFNVFLLIYDKID